MKTTPASVLSTVALVVNAVFSLPAQGQIPSDKNQLTPGQELEIAAAAIRHVVSERGWTRVALDPRLKHFETRRPARWTFPLPDAALRWFRDHLGVQVRRVDQVIQCTPGGNPRVCDFVDADGIIALGALRTVSTDRVSLEINTWYPIRSTVHSLAEFEFRLILERCAERYGWCVVDTEEHRIT